MITGNTQKWEIPLQKSTDAAQMQHAFGSYYCMYANCAHVLNECIPHAYENIVCRIHAGCICTQIMCAGQMQSCRVFAEYMAKFNTYGHIDSHN